MSRHRKRGRARKAARIAAILAVQAIAALLLAEIALRLFRPAPRGDNRFLRHDPELGYRVKPDLDLEYDGGDYRAWFSTDERGARRHPPPTGPPTAPLTVLAIGDSYTFCTGVGDDETYPYFLQQALARRLPERHVRVVNLGVGGFGLAQARLLGERHMEEIGADLVLLMMCSNDPEDDLGFRLGHDHSRGRHVDPAAYRRNPTELRRYLDVVLKRLDLWRPLWLPAWRIPLRDEQWRRLAPSYPELVGGEFAALARACGRRPLVTSLINYNLLSDATPPDASLEPGSLEALQRELLSTYVQTARRWSTHVSLADMQEPLFDSDGDYRDGYWNEHSGGHLSPRGNRVVAEFLAPALVRALEDG